MIERKIDALNPQVKESYLVPPEGEDYEGEDILEQVQQLAQAAADRLNETNPNGKVRIMFLSNKLILDVLEIFFNLFWKRWVS